MDLDGVVALDRHRVEFMVVHDSFAALNPNCGGSLQSEFTVHRADFCGLDQPGMRDGHRM
jgi:hypothetical protein